MFFVYVKNMLVFNSPSNLLLFMISRNHNGILQYILALLCW